MTIYRHSIRCHAIGDEKGFVIQDPLSVEARSAVYTSAEQTRKAIERLATTHLGFGHTIVLNGPRTTLAVHIEGQGVVTYKTWCV